MAAFAPILKDLIFKTMMFAHSAEFPLTMLNMVYSHAMLEKIGGVKYVRNLTSRGTHSGEHCPTHDCQQDELVYDSGANGKNNEDQRGGGALEARTVGLNNMWLLTKLTIK